MGDAAVSGLSFWLTTDLHFLGFLSRPKDELSPVKQPVHNIGLFPNPIVRHLAFAICAENNKNGYLPVLHLEFHLNVGFRTIVENPERPKMVITAGDLVAEVQFFRRDHRRQQLSLALRFPLLCALLATAWDFHNAFSLPSPGFELIPIIRIDGRVIGTGKPGPVTARLVQGYHALTQVSGEPI